jgi:hypothetical protein
VNKVAATAIMATNKSDFLIFLGILINNKGLVQVDLPGISEVRNLSLSLKPNA